MNIPTRVLVVDDEPAVRRLLEAVLQKGGFITAQAGDAEEAAELLAAGDFDLAFVDVHLPDESGIDLVRRAVEAGSPTQFILITGALDSGERSDAFDCGAKTILRKPFRTTDVLYAADLLLER